MRAFPFPILLLSLAFWLASAAAGLAQNATTPGATITVDPPTLMALGFAWPITGDADRDCTVTVEYTVSGGTTWTRAMDLFRPESRSFGWPDPANQGQPKAYSVGNLLAGSIIDLTPDTTYDVRFTLHDPDGGDATQTLTNIRTRKVPVASTSGRAITVTTSAELQAAADNAQAGDIITIKAGTYAGAFTFSKDGSETSPIVFRGENRDTVIFDATGNTGWTFNFSEPFDNNDNQITTGRLYNYLENFTLIHAKKAVRAGLTTGMVLRNTVMKDFPVGGTSDKSLGPYFGGAANAYICDNAFLGPEPDINRDRAGYGPSYNIELGGTGNVICHNVMTHWWDAITSTDSCYADKNCLANDIYNNLIMYATDDGMELDGMTRNIRALRNRVGSSYDGISVQPAFGGPVYIIRNEIFSSERAAFKFNPAYAGQDGPSGIVALHNSIANNARAVHGGTWSNVMFRNNILYTTNGNDVSDTIMSTTDNGFDFDYDSWRASGNTNYADWLTAGSYVMDVSFRDSATSRSYTLGTNATTGLCPAAGRPRNECNGLSFESLASEWMNVPEPKTEADMKANPTQAYGPADWDFTLADTSVSIDSGLIIPNVNDDYLGTAPDRGALEQGKPLPIYGPRASADGTVPVGAPTDPAGGGDPIGRGANPRGGVTTSTGCAFPASGGGALLLFLSGLWIASRRFEKRQQIQAVKCPQGARWTRSA
jgi:hypothetical protein